MIVAAAGLLAQSSAPAPPPAPPSSDQLLGFVLLDIVIILVAARLLGSLAKKIGQPAVVGEIIAGILLGPSLLGPTIYTWTNPPEFLHCQQFLTSAATTAGTQPPPPSITSCLFPAQSQTVIGILGQIALVLFMFLVGLELDYALLKGRGKGITLVALGAVVVPIAAAFLVGPYLFGAGGLVGPGTPGNPVSQTAFTLFIAGMLVVTAFPVMARILQEKRLTQSAMGAIGVAAAAVVTVLMFLTVGLASGVAANDSTTTIALRFVFAAIYLVGMFAVVRPALVPLGRRYTERGSMSPPMFAVIAIVFFASAFVANLIGINVIVGGFLAGAVLPARAGLFREMAQRLSDFTAVVLLPLFLAFSGLRTDFTKLGVDNIVPLAIFIVAAVAGKWIGGAVSARLGGLSWTEGNVLGVLMNCRGLLVLVVALIAFNTKVISAPMQVGGVLMALVTTMMTGPLFDVFAKRLPDGGAPPPAPSLAPAEPETFRVLVGISDLETAAELAQAAFALVGEQRPAEVVLCRPFPLLHRETMLAGSGEAGEAERSLRSLRILQSFAPAGIDVTPIAFASAAPRIDLHRVAAERGCDLLLTDWDDTAADGDHRVVRHRIPSTTGDGPSGPVLLVAGAEAPEARSLADALATALGTTVTAVDRLGPTAAAEVNESAAVVAVLSPADAGDLGSAMVPVYAFEPSRVTS